MDFTEIQLEENQQPSRTAYDSQYDMIHPESFHRIFVTDSSRAFHINERTNSEEQMTSSTSNSG